jgi:hypothetical protein
MKWGYIPAIGIDSIKKNLLGKEGNGKVCSPFPVQDHICQPLSMCWIMLIRTTFF